MMATPSKGYCYLGIDDLDTVYMCCKSVKAKWYTLATHLKVHMPTVEVQESSEKDPTKCLSEVLSAWLKCSSPPQPKPSWRSLCTALSSMGETVLSKQIQREHPCGCGLCKAITVLNLLEKLFNKILKLLRKEIHCVDLHKLQTHITKLFKMEEEIGEEIRKHLSNIKACSTSEAVLDYFIRHGFISYINYSLVKVFQLDKHIKEYGNEDYQHFLKLTLLEVHSVFEQCPYLCPKYPAGLPKFTIHLESEWERKSVLELKKSLGQCFNNSDCIDQMMIAEISRNRIIVMFTILPHAHITRTVQRYLTNNDVISALKKEGIIVDISEQYQHERTEEKETRTTTMDMTSKLEAEQNLQDQHVPLPDVLPIDAGHGEEDAKGVLHTEAFKKAKSKAVMWYEIGQKLGVGDTFLDDLKNPISSGDESSEKKLERVMDQWIEIKGGSPTLDDLDSVLIKVHRTMIIRNIYYWFQRIIICLSLMVLAGSIAYGITVGVYHLIQMLMIPSNFNRFPLHCRKDVHLYSIALAEKYNESEKDTSYLGYGPVQYVSLTMVRKENISETTSSDLMMAAVVGGANKVTEMREPIEFNDLFKPVSEKKLKLILITGTPGIGKSTLAMEIARSSPTNHHSVAILIRLREGDVKETNDLFIKKGLDHINIASVKSCVGHTKGEGVLWIVDGFDELPLREQRNKESIVHQLLQNEIYSGSTIVVTTRAISTTIFTEYLKKSTSKHVEIVGFSDSQIKHYVSQRFAGENNTALRSNFNTYYGSNPTIRAMMSIPLNAAIVTTIYEYRYTHSSSNTLRPIPHTQTGLYSALVVQVLQRHESMRCESLELIDGLMTRKDIEKLPPELQTKFVNLTKIAYIGITRDVYIFNDSDLFTQVDLRNHSEFDHLDLMNKVTSRKTDGSSVPRYTYHFLHTTLQEYLAAVYYLYTSNHTHTLEQPAKLGVFIFGISSVLQTEKEQVNHTLLNQIAEHSYRNVSNCFYFYEFPELQFSDRKNMIIYFHIMNWFFTASDMHSNAFKCGYLLANYGSILASKIMLADGDSTRMFVRGLTSNSSHNRMDDVSILGKIKDLNFFCNVNFTIADIIKLVSIAKPDELSLFVRDVQCARLISKMNYQPKHRFSIGLDNPNLIKETVQELTVSKVKITLFSTTNLTADLLTCPNISTLSLVANPNVSSPHYTDFNETEADLLSSTTTIKSTILVNNHLSRKGLRAMLSVKNSISSIALGILILRPEKSFYQSYWCLFLDSLFSPITTTYLSMRMNSPDIPEPLVQHPAELVPLSVLLWNPMKDLSIHAFTIPKTCYVLKVIVNWLDTHSWDYFVDLISALSSKNYFASLVSLTVTFPALKGKPTDYIKTFANLLSDFLLLLAQFVENSEKPLTAINLVIDYNDTEILLAHKPEILEHFEKLLKISLSKPYTFDVLIGHHDSHI